MPVDRHDVERILRDVLTARGLDIKVLAAERTTCGWRVTMKDRAERTFGVDAPEGPSAAIRAALEKWADSM